MNKIVKLILRDEQRKQVYEEIDKLRKANKEKLKNSKTIGDILFGTFGNSNVLDKIDRKLKYRKLKELKDEKSETNNRND